MQFRGCIILIVGIIIFGSMNIGFAEADPVQKFLSGNSLPETAIADGPGDTGSNPGTNLILVRYATREAVNGSDAGVSDELMTRINEEVGTTVVETFSPDFLPGLQAVQIPAGSDPDEIIARYRQYPSVVYAEPDRMEPQKSVSPITIPVPSESVASQGIPNDPLFPQQWALLNTGQTGGTPGADIDALNAWNITNESPDIVIGLIDSGVDYNHEDLKDSIWTDPVTGEHGYDFTNDVPDPMDDQSHGTHAAGIIAATGNNHLGVTGVTWKAKIMALKIRCEGDFSDYEIIRAIRYAKEHHADILVLPWDNPITSQAMKDAIEAFQGPFIWSTGHQGTNYDELPAFATGYSASNAIVVMATGKNDTKADYSNYGKNVVHLAAPGEEIISTVPQRKILFSDTFTTGANWTIPSLGGISPDRFTSAPSSLKLATNESTGDRYFTLKSPVNVSGAEYVDVSFQADYMTGAANLELEYSTSGEEWESAMSQQYFDDQFYPVRTCLFDRGADSLYLRFRYSGDPETRAYVDDLMVTALNHTAPDISYGYHIEPYLDPVSRSDLDASPFVAGTTALVMAIHPSYNTAQITSALLNSVDSIPDLATSCRTGGRLNASAALTWNAPAYDAITVAVPPLKFSAGNQSEVTIRMINAGTADWSNAAGIVLKPDNEVATAIGPSVIRIPETITIPPGGEYSFAIPVTAPGVFGSYEPRWRMYQGTLPFGEAGSRKLVVTTWEMIPSLPEPAIRQAVIADDAYIYSIGGINGSAVTDRNWRYDIRNASWSSRAPLPRPLYYASGNSVNGRLYVTGGTGGAGNSNMTYMYDPGTDSWSSIPSTGVPDRFMHQTGVLGERLYLLGGEGRSGDLDSVYYLNTSTLTWHEAPPMGIPRQLFAASSGDGSILVAGGLYDYRGLNSGARFDGNTWSAIPNITGTSSWFDQAGASSPDGSLWMAGGYRIMQEQGSGWEDQTASYNSSTNTWKITPDLPRLQLGRAECGGAMGLDGKFYVIGGRNSGIRTATAERLHVYDPVISPVTSLTNTTYATDRITWTWNEPEERVYGSVMIYLNGIFQENLTKGSSAFSSINLTPGTSYTLSTRTVDLFGTPDDAWANHTAMTALVPPVYTLHSSSDAFGYIRPEGVVTKPEGSDQTYDIRSLPGAEIARVTDNDTPVSVPAGVVSYTYPLTGIADNHTVIVANDAKDGVLLAAFTVNTTSGPAPLTVLFTDASAGGPDQWYWTFGDDTSSMDRNVNHTYTTPGVYDVSLWIRNNQATGSIEKPGIVVVR